jgi:putative transposase
MGGDITGQVRRTLCEEYQLSNRRVCGLVGISSASNGYIRKPDRHVRLRQRLLVLSSKHRRYGYRMLHAKLRQEGFTMNIKVTERLYNEERLTLRKRSHKGISKNIPFKSLI